MKRITTSTMNTAETFEDKFVETLRYAALAFREMRVRHTNSGFEFAPLPNAPRFDAPIQVEVPNSPAGLSVAARRVIARADLTVAEDNIRAVARLVMNYDGDDGDTPRPHDDKIYRVHIQGASTVIVICLGIDRVDSPLEGYYHEVEALPLWVRERLAVLMVTSPKPPTHTVEGVGRRISETVFWVYAP